MSLPTPYYEHGGITIYHGDALDVLPRLREASFGAYVTDPPYTAAGSSSNGRSSEYDGQFFRHWFRSVFAAMRRCTTPSGCAFIFCDWRTLGDVAASFRDTGETQASSTVWKVRQALVWDREGIGMGTPFRNSYEMIALASGGGFNPSEWIGKSTSTVVRFPWYYGAKPNHPAEKPVELLERIVSWAVPPAPMGYDICDPFMGSGTTLVAAKRKNQRCVGIEIEERYCEIAVKRLAQEVLPLEPAAPEPEQVSLLA